MKIAKDSNATALKAQRFDQHGLGTVVRDFEELLDFIGKDGVRATGKYSLPMDRLFELDERMSRPLRPSLKRPQLRSFPGFRDCFLRSAKMNEQRSTRAERCYGWD